LRALIGLAIAVYSTTSTAQVGQPIILGSSYTLHSRDLGEDRVVNVVLPADYDKKKDARYPVLYLIDGGVAQDLVHVAGVVQLGAAWGRNADPIIVGIETKDRRRELTGPTADPELRKKYPTVGGSAKFRAFIKSEVKPFVERRFRTNGSDAVIGESLAGLFILETYLVDPTLFDAYGAISPSLWWDKEALSLIAAKRVPTPKTPHPVYIAAADEGADMQSGIDRFVAALAKAGAPRCYNHRADLSHSTIYQQLTPQALQFLLPPASPPPAEYGFKVQCSSE
jgi:predicted alpha/beta superfamily hydrolase